MKVIYDNQMMKLIALFENLSNVKVKDAFLKDKLTFIVSKGSLRIVLRNINRIEDLMKRRIKIIEFDEDICKFAANIIYPVKAENIELKENELLISVNNGRTKGLLIGRESKNLKELKEVLSRYFSVEDVRIV